MHISLLYQLSATPLLLSLYLKKNVINPRGKCMGSNVPYCTKLTETVFFILKMLFCLQVGYSIYVDMTGVAKCCFSLNYCY